MRFKTAWIDVRNNLANQQQPVYLLHREKSQGAGEGFSSASVGYVGSYWVATNALLADEVELTLTTTGELVRVPMWAYDTVDSSLAGILALGIQLGMNALNALRRFTPEFPGEVTLALGHQCHDLRPHAESFRCYVGIVLRTK